MKDILKSFLLFIALVLFHPSLGQKSTALLSGKLSLLGFENVNVYSRQDMILVAFENNVYRCDVEAIAVALDTIVTYVEKQSEVSLYILDHGIPQIQIDIPAATWLQYRKGNILQSKMADEFCISYTIDKNFKLFAADQARNSNINKIDFVVYPQLALQNTSLNQIYETQFNLAPAIEVDMCKGMQFTGQVIFPIVNDLGPQGDQIRPGFVSLAQNFRIGKRFFARAVAGHFNANRYGLDGSVFRPFFKNRVEVEANVGVTGASYFYEGDWIRSSVNQLSWFIKTRYYHFQYNLQIAMRYGRFLNGDCGLRGDLTRHFDSVSIGFFAQYSRGRSNGGFHFAIPLMFKKRNRRRSLRVMPARYFDWEYNAGTDFEKGHYETRPNENRIENNYNPTYVKSKLLSL